MEKELRFLPIEFRENTDNERYIEGYALVFNSESRDLGGFIETITPEALEGVLEKSDVLCFLNHNEDRGLLARSTNLQGSLKLEIDARGLKYSFDAPKTPLGDELLEGLRRGDIRNSSFAFRIAQGGDKWEKRKDGKYLRTITKFEQIFDVSPVYKPAYENTEVAQRSLKDFQEQDNKQLEEVIDYYTNIKKQFNFLK